MKNQLIKYFASLLLLLISINSYAQPYTVEARVSKITETYIILDNGSNQKYDLVTEYNKHLKLYQPMTEFWIQKDKSDHETFKGIGYTHEAVITIDNNTVRKIVTIDDYIL